MEMKEQELITVNAKFHAVIDFAGDAIFLMNQDFTITEVNKSACNLIQYSADELLGMKIYELIKTDPSNFKAYIEKIDEQGGSIHERSFIRKDGSFVDTEVHVNRVEGIGYMTVARDITQRKLTELKFKQSEVKFRLAFMTGMDASYISTLEEGRIIEVNDMIYSLFGYAREECIGNTLTILNLFYDIDQHARMVALLKEKKHIRDLELKGRRKNGDIFICSISASTWNLNETDYILVVLRDVTAMKNTENKKIEMLEFESLLSDTAARLVHVHPQQLRQEITHSQRLICEFLNLDLSTIYQPLSDTGNQLKLNYIYHRAADFNFPEILIAADYFPWCEKELLAGHIPVVNSMKDLPVEAERDKESWNSFGIKSSVMFPMIADQDEFLGTISFDALRSEKHFSDELIKRLQLIANIFANIIKRNRSEVQLIIAKDKAEESDRLKSSFLANMSHEIRTPLNSIIGFSELLLDPFFDAEQQTEFVNTIKQNGINLLTIISDIMDISRIETGQINIRNNNILVSKLIDEITSEQYLDCKKKNLEIIATTPISKEIQFLGDEGRIKQILSNLVINAIKFTESGSIEIGCIKANNYIQFHVKDTGIGIPAEYHEKIFERFRQVEGGHTRKYGGNGLGLSIAKTIGGKDGWKNMVGI